MRNIADGSKRERKHLFLARRSFSASPVGANASAVVASSSNACRLFTYAVITALSLTISVFHSPSTWKHDQLTFCPQ